MDQRSSIRQGILLSAKSLGIDPIVLATAISYETKGTFNPIIKGPTTQYGQHEGLIQAGEPQARHLGIDWKHAVRTQLGPNGAVVKYLREAGVKPGMGLHEVYSAINAGHVGLGNRSDAKNGGAPGTVDEKVAGMGDHRENAIRFMGGVNNGKNSFATDAVANRDKDYEHEETVNGKTIADANKSIANRGPFLPAPFQPKNAAVVPHNANTDRDAPSRDTNKMNPNTLIQRMMAAGGRQSNNVEDMRPQQQGGNDFASYVASRSQGDDPGGSEVGYDSATLDDAIKQFGPDIVLSAPAEQVMQMLKRDVTPDEARYYDSLPPQKKQDILYGIAESDGLGSISSFMNNSASDTQAQVINKMGMNDGDGADNEGASDQDPRPMTADDSVGSRVGMAEDDPAFVEAANIWIQQNNRQPATDQDFSEIEQMIQSVKSPTGPIAQPQQAMSDNGVPRSMPNSPRPSMQSPQQMILQKMLGGGNR